MIAGALYLDREYHEELVADVRLTNTMFERMRGLLGRAPLELHQALLIKPCSAIHTFFMGYSLDLLFLDKHWQIRRQVSSVRPFRLAFAPGAAMVLEMAAGAMDDMTLTTGQTLYWKEKHAL